MPVRSARISATETIAPMPMPAAAASMWMGVRKTVEAAAALATEVNRALAPIREKKAIDALVQKGMTIETVDTKPYVAKAEPLQVELAAKIGAKDLLDKIKAAA